MSALLLYVMAGGLLAWGLADIAVGSLRIVGGALSILWHLVRP